MSELERLRLETKRLRERVGWMRVCLNDTAWIPSLRTNGRMLYRCRWCGIETPDRDEHDPGCPCEETTE